MKKKIIILGGRGNGTVIGSCLEDVVKNHPNDFEFMGYLNDSDPKDSLLDDYPVLGTLKESSAFLKYNDVFFIQAIITVKKAKKRIELLQNLNIPIEKYAKIQHPSSIVGKNVKLGFGTVLMPGVIISPGAVLGNHTQCYANSFVGHDTIIDEYCFIANNASVGGHIAISKGVHIGSNSSLREHIKIGEWSIIGLGSVVLKDVPPFTIYAGNPAKLIGENTIE